MAAVIGSRNKALFALLIVLLGPVPALAQSATNPVAPIPQLQIQNFFVPESFNASGYANQFIVQPVLPYKLGGLDIISRITLPVVTTADPDPILGPLGPIDIGGTTGLGDLTTINFAMGEIKDDRWGGDIGFGPAVVIPTGTDDRTGSGKLQMGPNFVYINTATPKLEWGVLAYQVWSVAGDDSRADVSTFWGQPILTVHLEDGWYLTNGDIIWSYDWEESEWSIPLGFAVGKVFKIGHQENNVFLEGFYDVAQPTDGNEWGIKLSWSLLFRH